MKQQGLQIYRSRCTCQRYNFFGDFMRMPLRVTLIISQNISVQCSKTGVKLGYARTYNVSYFSSKTYSVGIRWNHIADVVSTCTYSLCFEQKYHEHFFFQMNLPIFTAKIVLYYSKFDKHQVFILNTTQCKTPPV